MASRDSAPLEAALKGTIDTVLQALEQVTKVTGEGAQMQDFAPLHKAM